MCVWYDVAVAGKRLIGCHSIEELTKSLKRPRKVMLMVMAGDPVDQTIKQLLPHLEKVPADYAAIGKAD